MLSISLLQSLMALLDSLELIKLYAAIAPRVPSRASVYCVNITLFDVILVPRMDYQQIVLEQFQLQVLMIHLEEALARGYIIC